MLNYHGVWATRIGQSITCITLPALHAGPVLLHLRPDFVYRPGEHFVVAPMLMAEFGWDPAVTGTILSAFFVGYLLTQLPGGWLADRFGGKGIIGCAVLW